MAIVHLVLFGHMVRVSYVTFVSTTNSVVSGVAKNQLDILLSLIGGGIWLTFIAILYHIQWTHKENIQQLLHLMKTIWSTCQKNRVSTVSRPVVSFCVLFNFNMAFFSPFR
jgi:hypothetical protein